MKVRVKKLHKDAVLPKYAKPGDAGTDLTATEVVMEDGLLVCKAGIALEVPEGYVALLFSRSSIYKENLIQSNCVGVIDSGYRGEIMCKFRPYDLSKPAGSYQVGDRFAQLIIMPYPTIEYVESDELSETVRGANGYGSSNTPAVPDAIRDEAIEYVLDGIAKFNDTFPSNKFTMKFDPNNEMELLNAIQAFHKHMEDVEDEYK